MNLPTRVLCKLVGVCATRSNVIITFLEGTSAIFGNLKHKKHVTLKMLHAFYAFSGLKFHKTKIDRLKQNEME